VPVSRRFQRNRDLVSAQLFSRTRRRHRGGILRPNGLLRALGNPGGISRNASRSALPGAASPATFGVSALPLTVPTFANTDIIFAGFRTICNESSSRCYPIYRQRLSVLSSPTPARPSTSDRYKACAAFSKYSFATSSRGPHDARPGKAIEINALPITSRISKPPAFGAVYCSESKPIRRWNC
jgi:hypothetical protein